MEILTVSACFSKLESEALLHIAGPDTLKFLQGQTTCDTRKLTPTQALPGAYCTPQGRVVCDFLLVQLGDNHVVLRLRRDILDTAAATLGKYIMFSKADLDAARQDWMTIGCWGAGSAAALAAITGLELPGTINTAASGEGCIVVCCDPAQERYEVFIDSVNQPSLLEAVAQAMQPTAEAAWQAWQINAGIARVEAATSGEFVAQSLNYDLTGHISFNKGCYTGQEIVARLHYRGKPKQRTYLAELDSEMELPAGTALYSAGKEQSTGSVVNSATWQGKTCCLLATTAGAAEAGLELQGAGAKLHLLPLPYDLPG